MTNKMPVVGQRYLSTRTGWECELKRFNEETATAYDKYGTRLECVATRFWDYFEELPEDNLQETEEVKVNKKANPVDFEKGEVNEVERALEELKKSLVKPISANLNQVPLTVIVWQFSFQLSQVSLAKRPALSEG